jgi:uncharacterized membrane protein YfcA
MLIHDTDRRCRDPSCGLLIGLTGIGGVLVVPALTELGELGVERAVAAALFGFLICGSFAAFVHLRRTRLDAGALLALCVPVGPAIALGLAAQLPITLSATLVNAADERIDWVLGASLGAVLSAGTLAGAWLSARLHARRLEQAVGFALVATGLWYGYATLSRAGALI